MFSENIVSEKIVVLFLYFVCEFLIFISLVWMITFLVRVLISNAECFSAYDLAGSEMVDI